jgi:serine/threonine protein phosphatase PrpC
MKEGKIGKLKKELVNKEKDKVKIPYQLSDRNNHQNILFLKQSFKEKVNLKFKRLETYDEDRKKIKFNKNFILPNVKRTCSFNKDIENQEKDINYQNKEKLNINNNIHFQSKDFSNNNKNNIKNNNNIENKKKINLPKIINNNTEIIKDYYKSEDQNKSYRKEMEDKSCIKINIIEKENHKISLFAIFDGHGGKLVSEYLYNNYEKTLISILEKNNYNIEKSIKESFKEIDNNLEKIPNTKTIGSTATIILIDNNILYCANVGDSESYYISKDKIIKLTNLHNCKNKNEVERVKNSKGLIFGNRVFGMLNLTRSIGDFDFKIYGVINEPFIYKVNLIENYSKYVILGSDGVWDVINDSDLIQIEKKYGSLCKNFCNKIVEEAINKGSQDNISCIVIKF